MLYFAITDSQRSALQRTADESHTQLHILLLSFIFEFCVKKKILYLNLFFRFSFIYVFMMQVHQEVV
jgi:hypothetical protein